MDNKSFYSHIQCVTEEAEVMADSLRYKDIKDAIMAQAQLGKRILELDANLDVDAIKYFQEQGFAYRYSRSVITNLGDVVNIKASLSW